VAEGGRTEVTRTTTAMGWPRAGLSSMALLMELWAVTSGYPLLTMHMLRRSAAQGKDQGATIEKGQTRGLGYDGRMSPEKQLAAMMAEVKEGRSPAALVTCIQESGRQPGWLSRILSPDTLESCAVLRIVPFEDGGFFQRSRVFTAWTAGHWLEGVVLPHGGTFGLFSVGPEGVRYLSGQREAVEALLRGEGRPPSACDPMVLARLISEALLRRKNDSHDVIGAAEQLAHYSQGGQHPGGYEVDPGVLSWVRGVVRPPALEEEPEGEGWLLTFYTVFGWMHDKQALVRHTQRIGVDCSLRGSEEVVARRVFSRTPALRY
jgi:hypothetical protein